MRQQWLWKNNIAHKQQTNACARWNPNCRWKIEILTHHTRILSTALPKPIISQILTGF